MEYKGELVRNTVANIREKQYNSKASHPKGTCFLFAVRDTTSILSRLHLKDGVLDICVDGDAAYYAILCNIMQYFLVIVSL